MVSRSFLPVSSAVNSSRQRGALGRKDDGHLQFVELSARDVGEQHAVTARENNLALMVAVGVTQERLLRESVDEREEVVARLTQGVCDFF